MPIELRCSFVAGKALRDYPFTSSTRVRGCQLVGKAPHSPCQKQTTDREEDHKQAWASAGWLCLEGSEPVALHPPADAHADLQLTFNGRHVYLSMCHFRQMITGSRCLLVGLFSVHCLFLCCKRSWFFLAVRAFAVALGKVLVQLLLLYTCSVTHFFVSSLGNLLEER